MFNWNNIWKNVPLITNEARLIALNWKILSNIYPTNIFLAKIGKARSSKCSKCDVEDYLEHFFFYCKSVKQFWNEVNSIIHVQMVKSVTLSVTTSAVVDTTFVDIYVDTKNIPTCRYNIQHIDKRTMEK